MLVKCSNKLNINLSHSLLSHRLFSYDENDFFNLSDGID